MAHKMVTIVMLLAFAVVFIPTHHSRAAEFNPNLILSDAELADFSSLTEAEIESFLKAKGSGLAGRLIADLTGTPRLASAIIFAAAQTYKINPRYLLTLIQKEQSLVEDASPGERQLAWATGYGVCDGCSTDDPAIQKYHGFAKQIDYGAGAARFFLDNPTHYALRPLGQTTIIDGVAVIPTNVATSFLYTYTPHLHGNQNLWRIWNKWFTRVYPNGSIIQAQGDKDIWLVQNGLRRKFATMAAFVSRATSAQILTVQMSDLLTFKEGPSIKFANYSLLRGPNGFVYLLVDDTLHPFASTAVLGKLGYHPEEVIDVASEDLTGFAKDTFITTASIYPLGAILQDKKSKTIYYVKNGNRRVVMSAGIAAATFPKLKIRTTTMKELAEYPLVGESIKFRDGQLIAAKGSPHVYVVADGVRRPIPNEAVFKGLGYKWDNVVYTDEQSLIVHAEGAPVELVTDAIAVAAK